MSKPPFKPKFAEWVSFGISLAMIVLLAGFLVYEAVTRDEVSLPIAIELQTDKVVRAGERFVLPIKIRNLGKATMRALQIRVGFDAPNAPAATDLSIEYLGEESEQTIHLYTDADPRSLNPWAKPLVYQVD